MNKISIFVLGFFIASAIGVPINETSSSQNLAKNEIISNSAPTLVIREYVSSLYEVMDEEQKCYIVSYYGFKKCVVRCLAYCKLKKCGSFKKCTKIPNTKTSKGSKYECICKGTVPKIFIKESELNETLANVEKADVLEMPKKIPNLPLLKNSQESGDSENLYSK